MCIHTVSWTKSMQAGDGRLLKVSMSVRTSIMTRPHQCHRRAILTGRCNVVVQFSRCFVGLFRWLAKNTTTVFPSSISPCHGTEAAPSIGLPGLTRLLPCTRGFPRCKCHAVVFHAAEDFTTTTLGSSVARKPPDSAASFFTRVGTGDDQFANSAVVGP